MITGIVLAAGLSRRFPGNKLLFNWNGKPVIRWTVENALASKLNRVIVVLGHDAGRISSILDDLDVEKVYNPYYMEGMSSSVKTGVRYVWEKYGLDLEAVLITPGDTAWIPPEAYNMVIDAFQENKGRKLIFVASYRGRRGHPILFDSVLVPEILAISEATRGLKFITRKYYYDTMIVETPYPGVALDLDTYNDLNRVKYMLKK